MFVKPKHLAHVTWDEIREAERLGERKMEFELTDILEEVSIWGRELDEKLEENIEHILKREGLYDPEKMGGVVIPAGALHYECPPGETCWYSADFEVFDKTGNRIIARGTAYGTMIPLDKKMETMEIMDMTVAMPTSDVKRLKQMVGKAVSLLKHLVAGIFSQ